jgi:signal transduction histidine kinase
MNKDLSSRSDKKINWRKWLYIFSAWTAAALFFASSFVLQNQISAQPISVWKAVAVQLASSYGWFVLMPVILWLANHYPLDRRGNPARNVAANLIGGVALVLVHLAWDAFSQAFLGYRNRQFETYFSAFAFQFYLNFHWSCVVYLQINIILYGIRYYNKYRAGELRASKLEARLAQTRLKVLQMQLHPHFLFNTHNAIAELIHKNPDAAEKMVENLSDLLRMSLNKLNVEEVSFQQELEFLNKYLEIEQTRFHDRLQIKKDIAPDTLDATVPNMILQPLVENAVKHGIAPLIEGGTIEIRSVKENGNLRLQIRDDGIGAAKEIVEGIGISNTRRRLKQLYENAYEFRIEQNKEKGMSVNLIVPFRRFEIKKGISSLSEQQQTNENQNLDR